VLSSRRNAYLIVAIDGFTKFAFLKAVRNIKVGPVRKFWMIYLIYLVWLDELCVIEGVVLPANVSMVTVKE
jgi:hypothetical protein